MVTSHKIGPGAGEQERPDAALLRAAERVELACRALAAATNDLRVAHDRNKRVPVDNAADMAAAETERVCELAEELTQLAMNLTATATAGPAS